MGFLKYCIAIENTCLRLVQYNFTKTRSVATHNGSKSFISEDRGTYM